MPSLKVNNSNNVLTRETLETKMPLEKKDKTIIKIAVAGEGGVGKTTLCQRAMGKILDDYFFDYKITIGVQFFTHNVKTDCGPVVLSVWDLAGQPQFYQIVDRFLRGCKGVILAYDSTMINTFFSLYHDWIPLIKENCDENIPILIVSTKNDLEEKQVDPETVKEFIDARDEHNLNVIGFLETSAKFNTNVRETFDTLCNKIIEKEYTKEHTNENENSLFKNRFFG